MRELKTEEDYDALIRGKTPVLVVQFGSEQCGPCRAIRQKLEAWAEAQPRAEALYVPLDRFPALAARESIFTVPAVLVYAEGKVTLRECGCFSLDELLDRTERYLSLIGL